ncbi:MAG: HlyD family secretion protein [Psychromonas sp.]|jgi:HlyD family secretion protein|uniref:efflux RND transporter periplasmic adaptor subunit n=1 Tax=Psychromonas sp. TaxID=1884585 RepID=UPI0039E4241E
MLKRHRLLIISVLIIVTIGAFIVYLQRPRPVAVVVQEVSNGEVLATITNTRAGTLKACRRARLSPSVGGQIESLLVKEGDRVKAGQLLLEIWNDDLQAQVTLAEHESERSTALVREACIIADLAKREAYRLSTLFKKNMVSAESVDQAESEANARQAACQAAHTSVKVSQSQIDVARAALARTRLSAPFNGRVAEVNGAVGEFLTPSPIGVATLPAIDLIDYSCLYVSAPIDEVDAPQVRPQMPARISLDAFAGKTFAGTVRRVADYVLDLEKQSRTVEIEVEFINIDNTDNMLPGYSADAEVILQQRDNVLRIPTAALFEANRVLILKKDGLLEQRQLTIGISNWSFTEVLEGLSAGEQLVTSIEREGVEQGVRAVVESKDVENNHE